MHLSIRQGWPDTAGEVDLPGPQAFATAAKWSFVRVWSGAGPVRGVLFGLETRPHLGGPPVGLDFPSGIPVATIRYLTRSAVRPGGIRNISAFCPYEALPRPCSDPSTSQRDKSFREWRV